MKTPGCVHNRVDFVARIFRQLNFPATALCRIFSSTYSAGQNPGKVVLAMSLFMLALSAPVLAQQEEPGYPHLGPFEEQIRTDNPLRESFNVSFRPTPVAIDIDTDSDTDVMVADFDGGNGFYLFRNDGSPSVPAFNQARYSENPFEYISFDDGATPTFTDLDNDGDADMLLGVLDGTFRYYQKTPTFLPYTLQSGSWDPDTKAGNPFHGIDLGDYASPVFIDMDDDGDDDVVVGTSYAPNDRSIHYYVNDGTGVFTPGTLTGVNPVLDETTPAFADIDGDGDKDLVLGAADGNLYYYERTGQTTFEEQTGSENPFDGVNRGARSSPSAADFDNDGDADIVFGAEHATNDIFFFENKGNGVFEEKTIFDNPFGGIDVSSDASPIFVDFDTDGDDDLIIGSTSNVLNYFENVNGEFVQHTTTSPFNGLTVPSSFSPSFIDLDGDGDQDIVGGVEDEVSSIAWFQNDNGAFEQQSFLDGPFGHIGIEGGNTDFVDIDDDGDFDLFITEEVWENWTPYFYVRFYRNTGTSQSPVFTEVSGNDNPLNTVVEEFEIFPRFTDIDHDGDLDALIGESGDVVEISDGNEFSYYENTGSKTSPVFTYRGDLIQQGTNPFSPAPSFTDYDDDGDLDIFIGNIAGQIAYFRNVNPAPELAINAAPLDIESGSGAAVVDPELVVSDEDTDSIALVAVTIVDHEPGKTFLTFAPPPAGISDIFDEPTGVLTFSGKAPLADYQALLRTVAFEYIDGSVSGRSQRTQATTISKVIAFSITDSDGTYTPPVSRTVNIISGSVPVFNDHSVTLSANSTITIDLASLISDADGDIDWGSLAVTEPLASSAAASISNEGILLVDYSGVVFAGHETVTVTVCDQTGSCDDAMITLTVTNTAPIFNDHSANISFGQSVTVDLKTLVSDAESNVSYGTFAVVNVLASGATTNIDNNGFLTVSYSNLVFAGTETLQLQICDVIGACHTGELFITVTNSSPVIQPPVLNTTTGLTSIVNLAEISSDLDGNLDHTAFEIVQQPSSGAVATIVEIGPNEVNLVVDYSSITFAGTDQLTIRACDNAGACVEGTITIEVSGILTAIEVFNAVSPNSVADNRYMRIANLPASNKVTILNRWGDVVFQVYDYDNDTPGKRFEGISSNSKPLSSGTYFYTIEFFDAEEKRKTLTGYLALKH